MSLARLALVGLVAFLGLAAATATPVDCAEPVLRSVSPDARHSLAICRGGRLLALPGQAEAAAHAVLRDAEGRIEGIVAIADPGAIAPPAWGAAAVALPEAGEIGYTSGQMAALRDGFWRLRAWLRAVPRDEEWRAQAQEAAPARTAARALPPGTGPR